LLSNTPSLALILSVKSYFGLCLVPDIVAVKMGGNNAKGVLTLPSPKERVPMRLKSFSFGEGFRMRRAVGHLG
jgi:hypothetical protein